MKKLLSVILAAAIAGALAVGALAVPLLRGDASGDGALNVRDAIALAALVAGGGEANELADWNGDGVLNARDVIGLMRYLVGHYEANDDLLELTYGVSEQVFDVPAPVAENVVSGADFGIVPEAADNSAAFSAAAAYLAAHPGTTLRLEGATYRMGGSEVLFNGVKNCVIDGGGSTLLYNKLNYFSLWMCEGIEFTGLTFKWDHDSSHAASLVRIKSVSKRNSKNQATVEFEFYKETDASYLLSTDWGVMFSLDEKTLSPGLPGRIDYVDLGTHITERELTGPNVVTAKISDSIEVREGEVYLLRHNQYDGTVFNVARTSGAVFEDLSICTGPGVGFIAKDLSHHLRWTNVRIEPDPDEFERFPISTASDGINIRDTLGYIIIEDTSIGRCYDDCVNIRDNVGVTTNVKGDTLDMWTVNSTAFKAGDTLSFRDPKTYAKRDFTATVTASSVASGTNYTLTLDRECEGIVGVGDIVCDDSTDTAHIIIRNCDFHHNRSRGVLLSSPDCVIENCRFERNTSQALQISVDPTEGSGVDNLIVRGCEFRCANVRAFNNGASIVFSANNAFSERRPTIFGECFTNVLIAHNRFVDPCGPAIQALSVRALTVYANTVEVDDPREGYLQSGLGKIRITGSYFEDCRVLGNVWIDSPYMPSGANVVTYTAGRGTVTVDGNRIG